MTQTRVAVIGGGASGLMAAVTAKKSGADVTVFERNNRIGKKILATGNGRCNYTNIYANGHDYNHPDYVAVALNQCPPQKTIGMFQSFGIEPKIESEGKAYPLSEQASSIVDVFLYEINSLNITTVVDALVTRIIPKRDGFEIFLADGRQFEADKVILATGGKAMPRSGSDGNGYQLAEQLGHHITDIFPSIVKLKLDSPYLKHLQGIKLPTKIQLLKGEEVIQEEVNDVIFGDYGISGPAVLDLSREANRLMMLGHRMTLRLILLTTLTPEDIERRFIRFKDKPVDQALIGLIHKRYISAIIKEAGIEKQSQTLASLMKAQKDQLIKLLFDWRFPITGSKSFHDAQATAGGVSIEEIDPFSMASKLVPGLYLTGEVMDIDGRCGGFNLQWAWSSGYIAGEHAAGGSNDTN